MAEPGIQKWLHQHGDSQYQYEQYQMGGGGGGRCCTTIFIEKTNKQISVLTCPPLEVKMPLKLQTGPENINVARITSIKYVSKMQ